MCFGEGLADDVTAAITELQRDFLKSSVGFQVFGAAVAKLLLWRLYKKMLAIRRQQEELFIPLIRARMAQRDAAGDEDFAVYCYVDSLLALRIPKDGGRNRTLTEGEMVSLCTEFLSGPVDSTVTAIQWTMANVVARPEIQAKLRAEIHDVAGAGAAATIQDEHLPRMPFWMLECFIVNKYIVIIIKESPYFSPQASQNLMTSPEGGVMLEGFTVPKHASVNFSLGDMAMDEEVWPDLKRFRPERFLPGGEGEDVDLTGSKEIKMMPFGAGRRACPGIDMSLLHLEYFVATMVKEFECMEVPGEPVDFADKLELTMVMRRPLRAKVVPCC
ncbi:Cytochrome P450 89A9 [Dichanthelium oligosanthes]|uniref:Cytochrome P450 89A9 n=1 Tax=Dichanthelium oligosanthes TaxID=888268 RepID=A0A1E5VF71_9POAL|nr:Cytochrome P450 89A9 [Dichanthelium oligosanthes]